MKYGRQHFGWSTPADVAKTFENNVWEGSLMRLLYSVSLLMSRANEVALTVPPIPAHLLVEPRRQDSRHHTSQGDYPGVGAQGTPVATVDERSSVGPSGIYKE